MTIDTEGGQPFLSMGSQHSCKIHSTRTFRPIKAPYGFRVIRVHVHSLWAVAPTWGNCNGRTNTLSLKLLSTSSTLRHTTYRRISNDTLHGTAIAIAQIRGNQISHSLCQGHGLLFQTLTNTPLTTIDRGANTDFGIYSIHHPLILFLIIRHKGR